MGSHVFWDVCGLVFRDFSEESTGQGKVPGGGGGSDAVRGILTVPHSPSLVAAISGQKLNAMHGVWYLKYQLVPHRE